MATRIWVGISRSGESTRILVQTGHETVLKARLSSTPAHPRALSWLLEALALWQGAPVHAVLCATGSDAQSAAPMLPDWFPDFGGPLYTLELTDRVTHPRRPDRLGGLGDFRDLKRALVAHALESER